MECLNKIIEKSLLICIFFSNKNKLYERISTLDLIAHASLPN